MIRILEFTDVINKADFIEMAFNHLTIGRKS